MAYRALVLVAVLALFGQSGWTAEPVDGVAADEQPAVTQDAACGQDRHVLGASDIASVSGALGPSAPAQQGCCSHHDGVCGCQSGRASCCDGTLSPSCGCD